MWRYFLGKLIPFPSGKITSFLERVIRVLFFIILNTTYVQVNNTWKNYTSKKKNDYDQATYIAIICSWKSELSTGEKHDIDAQEISKVLSIL